jgi:hypothetical protein
MGSYISQEDFNDIEESFNRRRNTIKIFFISMLIIVLQLVSYALMNVGR